MYNRLQSGMEAPMRLHRWWDTIGFYLTFLLWIEMSSAQLCKQEVITRSQVTLKMDALPITGSSGICSCKITLGAAARLTMYPEIQVPECSTGITLSSSYAFSCINGKISSLHGLYFKDYSAGDTLWMFVISTSGSRAMSGTLQMKTKPSSSEFTLECFEPNTNSSTPTLPTSTTTTTTTTTTTALPTSASTTTTKTTPLIISSSTTTTTETSSNPSPQQPPNPPVGNTTIQPVPIPSNEVPSSTSSSVDAGHSAGSGSTQAGSSESPVDQPRGQEEKDFPVAAVAGGIAGGVVLILIIIIIVALCVRKRKKDQRLLEDGDMSIKRQGYSNKAYSHGLQNSADGKQSTNPPVHLENDLYVSADKDPESRKPKVAITNSIPGQYATLDEIGPNPLEYDSLVGGSEVVVTSSGDIYAVVDKSVPPEDDPSHEVSPSGDVYAAVNKNPKVTPDNMVHGKDDLYATVNKERQATDPTEEEEAAAIRRMMKVPDEVLLDRVSSVESTAL